MVKARVQKRLYYKIGEACKALGIQPYVLRYWETEFPALAPSKSRSGQRVYSEKELEIIRRIKELLYDEGYTIAGAKKKLEAELANGSVGGEPGDGETMAPAAVPAAEEAPEAAAAPATPAKASRARKQTAPAVVDTEAEPSLPFALDTGAAERIQTLRSGIEQALQEAREILALLEPKSP
ncbi:MerR family transcriptional regulator [bacterium]|nr:MAG: MerR family transcriptional regulator [bacterium]